MTKFKKIIPALCMLLISAVLMGTSTYAWFSMNTSVTATGMNVTATSNSRYLLIGTGTNNTATLIQGQTTNTTVAPTKTAGSEKVYPCAYTTSAITVSDEVKVEANNWYTANNKNSNSATDSVSNYIKVSAGEANYMITYKVFLTLSKDSEAYNGDLVVTLDKTADAGSKNGTAVSAFVKVGSDAGFILKADKSNHTLTNVSIPNDDVVEVTVYVFVDGTDSTVYSDNVNNGVELAGTLGLKFEISPNTAA